MADIDLQKLIKNQVNIQNHIDKLHGFYIPALAMQWALGINVMPLRCIAELCGEPDTMKTTLAYQMLRWFFDDIAYVVVIDTEHKASAAMLENFFAGVTDQITYIEAFSSSDWHGKLIEQVAYYKELADKLAKRGLNLPIVICIDSLYGSQSTMNVDKVIKEGNTSSTFAAALAKELSTYVPALQSDLEGYGHVILFTNHLKNVGIGSFGAGQHKKDTPGGMSPKFLTTFRLRNRSISPIVRYNGLIVTGKTIQMMPFKNSLGPSGQGIVIDVKWTRFADDDGNVRQNTYFEWDVALTDLVSELVKHGDYKPFADFLGYSTSGNKYLAENFVKEPMTAVEFGRFLSTPQMVPYVQRALAIERRPVYYDGKILEQSEYFAIRAGNVPAESETKN